MTDDTLLPFDLPSVCRKKITVDFNGGNQSSDGGLLLLREKEGPVAELVGIEVGSTHPALKRRSGDHAMKNVTSKPELSHPAIESNSHLFDDCLIRSKT